MKHAYLASRLSSYLTTGAWRDGSFRSPSLYERALRAYQRREWKQGYAIAMAQTRTLADHAPSYHLAGACALEERDWVHALPLLQTATRLDPEDAGYAVHWAEALALTDNLAEALLAANHAVSLAPTDPAVLNTLGVVFRLCQAHRHALDAFGQAVYRAPEEPDYRYNLALALVQIADLDVARDELEAVLRLKPDHWEAHYALSRLGANDIDHKRADSLRHMLDHCIDNRAYVHGHMALGHLSETVDDYAQALIHYRLAKATVRPAYARSPERLERIVNAMMASLRTIAPVSGEASATDPIFLVGMAHSGLTLVERMLATHTLVHPTGACPSFGMAFKALTRTEQCLDWQTNSRQSWMKRLGERYLQSTRPLAEGRPRFVDRFPHNFLYLGYIAQALPGATIIALRRHPMDLCLSTFRTLHPLGDEFFDYTLNLETIAHYYTQHERLMAHWRSVLPGRILEVSYEDLVHRRSEVWCRILKHAKLPWQALSFHPEHITPIDNDGSTGRWRQFGEELAPLRADLERMGIPIDD